MTIKAHIVNENIDYIDEQYILNLINANKIQHIFYIDCLLPNNDVGLHADEKLLMTTTNYIKDAVSDSLILEQNNQQPHIIFISSSKYFSVVQQILHRLNICEVMWHTCCDQVHHI